MRTGLAALCLIMPCVAVLWTPSYNRVEPQVGGLPFFYAYQLAWVPLSALCIAAAQALLRRPEASAADDA